MMHTTRRTARRAVRGGRERLRLLLCALSFLIIGTAFLAMPLAVAADHGGSGNGMSMGDDHGNGGNGAGMRDRHGDNATNGVDMDNGQRQDNDANDDRGAGTGTTMNNDNDRHAGTGTGMGTGTGAGTDNDDAAAGMPGMTNDNNMNDDHGADRNDNDGAVVQQMGGTTQMPVVPVVRDDDR